MLVNKTAITHEARRQWQLALPLVTGLLIAVLPGIVDTVLLAPLGTVALAAASITTTTLIIFYSCLYGMVSPVGVLAGQAYGASEPQAIGQVLHHGVPLALAAGLFGAAAMAAFYPLLPYLNQPQEVVSQMKHYWLWMCAMLVPFCMKLVYKSILDSTNRAWTATGLMLITPIANGLLAYGLIYGAFGLPQMGLTGAGVASFLGSLIGLWGLQAYFRFAPAMQPYRTHQPYAWAHFKKQLREGVPIALQYLLEGGAVAVAGVLIGWLGAAALAANQIVLSTMSFLYMLPLGMASAVTIRMAQAVGEKRRGDFRLIGFTGLGLTTLWMLVITAALVIAAKPLAAFFTADSEVQMIAAALFVVVALMQVFDGMQSVSVGALRGLMDNDWPTVVSLVSYWLIALPFAYVLGFMLNWQASGIWLGFGAGLLIASLAMIHRFMRLTDAQNA